MKKNLCFLFVLIGCFHSLTASIIYVNQNATGNNNGLSWANAYTDIQSAISLAIAGDEIWVAMGNYKPTTGTDRTVSFILKSSVKMYGGFNGTETLLSQRDVVTNTTILNGDIGQLGLNTDNSIHLITVTNASNQTRLDGFRIINAYAWVTPTSYTNGGGMYITGTSSPIVANCNFQNNYGQTDGSAIYMNSTATTEMLIDNCYFAYNDADGIGIGGGTFAMLNGKVRILNSSFINNSGNEGGAIRLDDGECRIDRCIIAGNTTTGVSIAAAILATGVAVFQMYNSLIIGNECSHSILYFDQVPSSTIVNCTFAHNKATTVGTTNPMLQFDNSFGTSSISSFRNNIVWGNTSPQISTGYGSVISNSIIQGGYTGGVAILNSNPNFLLPSTLANAPFDTTGVNYHVNYFAPPTNAGNNTYISATFNKDLDGIVRPYGATVDMGAYELDYCLANPTILASGPTTFCNGSNVTLSLPSNIQSQTWSNNVTSPTITVSSAGNYSVTTVDSAGCIGTASQQVVVNFPSTVINGNNNVCEGDTITLTASGITSYIWSTGATTSTIPIFDNASVWVYGANTAGCADTAYKTVTLRQKPVAVVDVLENSSLAANDGIICAGSSANLIANGGNTYSWNIGLNSASIAVAPTSSQAYFVKVSNIYGCFAFSDTIDITVLPLPNVAFSFMDTVLSNATPITLSGGSPAGGVYGGFGVSNGILDPQVVGSGSNTISYTFTDNNLCAATVVENYFLKLFIGISEAFRPKLSLFPNPADKTLHIKGNPSETYICRILTTKGEELQTNEFIESMDLDVASLPSGVYLIAINGYYWKWMKQ